MKKALMALAALSVAALPLQQAYGWARAGAWGHASGGGGSWSASGWRGGSASGSGGSWSGSGFRGGSASGGGGSWSGTGYRGGTASGGDGYWHGTGAYGGTASGGYNSWHATSAYHPTTGYYGGYYGGYHPPVVVNNYGSGCYNCGGWGAGGAVAAGLVGASVGAAVASAATANATANAYAAGVATGAAAANSGYIIGDLYATLPAGCSYAPVGGKAYYGCGNGPWFVPSYGANGVSYRAVAVP
jgi:hypothetical protein